MTVKSWMDAQRHKGGPVKYLYDKLDELDSSSKDIEDLEELIGDESTEGTILARIKALEDASSKNGRLIFFLILFFYIPSFFLMQWRGYL